MDLSWMSAGAYTPAAPAMPEYTPPAAYVGPTVSPYDATGVAGLDRGWSQSDSGDYFRQLSPNDLASTGLNLIEEPGLYPVAVDPRSSAFTMDPNGPFLYNSTERTLFRLAPLEAAPTGIGTLTPSARTPVSSFTLPTAGTPDASVARTATLTPDAKTPVPYFGASGVASHNASVLAALGGVRAAPSAAAPAAPAGGNLAKASDAAVVGAFDATRYTQKGPGPGVSRPQASTSDSNGDFSADGAPGPTGYVSTSSRSSTTKAAVATPPATPAGEAAVKAPLIDPRNDGDGVTVDRNWGYGKVKDHFTPNAKGEYNTGRGLFSVTADNKIGSPLQLDRPLAPGQKYAVVQGDDIFFNTAKAPKAEEAKADYGNLFVTKADQVRDVAFPQAVDSELKRGVSSAQATAGAKRDVARGTVLVQVALPDGYWQVSGAAGGGKAVPTDSKDPNAVRVVGGYMETNQAWVEPKDEKSFWKTETAGFVYQGMFAMAGVFATYMMAEKNRQQSMKIARDNRDTQLELLSMQLAARGGGGGGGSDGNSTVVGGNIMRRS
jgi:hypothetical protein